MRSCGVARPEGNQSLHSDWLVEDAVEVRFQVFAQVHWTIQGYWPPSTQGSRASLWSAAHRLPQG
jgi:hypothetical protein